VIPSTRGPGARTHRLGKVSLSDHPDASPDTTHGAFADLLAANSKFAETMAYKGFDGVAHAGVAMVTCMDSRIDPLGMIGLKPGDAKILRNPGGHMTPSMLSALVLGVHLLRVDRILVVQHTRCAMASSSEHAMHERLRAASGLATNWMGFNVISDQDASLRRDVGRVRTHPMIPARVEVGGFLYDVDTGLLRQIL